MNKEFLFEMLDTMSVSGNEVTLQKKVIKEIMWPLVVMLIVLVIVTYIPDVVLFLPRVFMRYGG